VKKGTLKFPSDLDTPVVLIGPGTGIAPFISFLSERQAASHHTPMKRHKNFVFTGNRNRQLDFLHGDWLLQLQKEEKYFASNTLESRSFQHSPETKRTNSMFSICWLRIPFGW
jgi:sulfite reductase alpha subunit-like flavoprotein